MSAEMLGVCEPVRHEIDWKPLSMGAGLVLWWAGIQSLWDPVQSLGLQGLAWPWCGLGSCVHENSLEATWGHRNGPDSRAE